MHSVFTQRGSGENLKTKKFAPNSLCNKNKGDKEKEKCVKETGAFQCYCHLSLLAKFVHRVVDV